MHDLIEPTSFDFSISPSMYEDSTYVTRSVPSNTSTWKQNQHFESKIDDSFFISQTFAALDRDSILDANNDPTNIRAMHSL